MAKLIVPKTAVRGPDSRGKIEGKWHLLILRGPYAGQEVTICKLCCDGWTKSPVRKLKAEDMCHRCLGAMEVTD